eukprot:CAMPEP_0206449624 /NCGR_PEP_ID=MMETSP0324_2-20121206/18209_1 /ASSEMBLY_ACC=CAM_ASM_000836 /TAXON_ID=2866 /ORGANISM="Crypthecodinium cohnii, Strain Seligo" /LENGTH=523 /DNA_ID=CAMNT_0053919055 /DNA_START=57 /DNA_END=1628 /DNA_ORIENTATION=-
MRALHLTGALLAWVGPAAGSSCPNSDSITCQVDGDDIELLQVTSQNALKRKACTASGDDPYVTGDFVACCSGLEQCLKAWDGDGRWFYKCYTAGAQEASGAQCGAAPAPPPPAHTRPDVYYPHFDTTPDYLNIAAEAKGVRGNHGKISDNFYLVIADQGGADGGCNGCGERQIKVAEKMKQYVAQRKQDNPNSKLLFVLAGGDNFYWTGASPGRFKATWADIYGEELTSVPWFAVMGNHDYGNSDPGTACPWKKPRFTCDESNINTAACGGPNPYSTGTQTYNSNQLNSDKGGVDGDTRKNFQMPDYTYFYQIPELDFELLVLDWNKADFGGLGGDGPDKSASQLKQVCGGIDELDHGMTIIQEASKKLFFERIEQGTTNNVAILGHYPGWSQGNFDFRDEYLARSPGNRANTTKVMNFFGHAHTQVCFTFVDGECVNFQTGGGGGCCGDGDIPGGFAAITFDDESVQKTECFAPDSRCSIMNFAERGLPRFDRDDVCHHTLDDPKCPGYHGPEGMGMSMKTD